MGCKAAGFGVWGHSRASGWGAPNAGHAWPVTAQGGFAAGEITSIACKACPEVVQYICWVGIVSTFVGKLIYGNALGAPTPGAFFVFTFSCAFSFLVGRKPGLAQTSE